MSKTIAAVLAVGVLAASGTAAAAGWRTVGSSNDSNSFLADAEVHQGTVRHVHALRVIVHASQRAKVSGYVMCLRGLDEADRNFAYHTYGGVHALPVPIKGGSCSVLVDAELRNGGSVRVTLQAR